MRVPGKNTLLLFLLFEVSFTMACKKDKQPSKTILVEVPPEIEVPQKNYIPIQLGSGRSQMKLSYTSNHSISKIEYADGSSTVMSYTTDGKPFGLSRYNGKTLVFSNEYILDKNGIVVSVYQYILNEQGFNAIGHYDMTYNTQQQLIAVSYYDRYDKLLSDQHRTYDAIGNLTSEKSNSAELTTDYLYDDKNGLFKNVKYAWLLSVEKENKLFLSVLNNIRQCNYSLMPDSNQNFSYIYNINKYPETVSSTAKGITSSIAVTYLAIETSQ